MDTSCIDDQILKNLTDKISKIKEGEDILEEEPIDAVKLLTFEVPPIGEDPDIEEDEEDEGEDDDTSFLNLDDDKGSDDTDKGDDDNGNGGGDTNQDLQGGTALEEGDHNDLPNDGDNDRHSSSHHETTQRENLDADTTLADRNAGKDNNSQESPLPGKASSSVPLEAAPHSLIQSPTPTSKV